MKQITRVVFMTLLIAISSSLILYATSPYTFKITMYPSSCEAPYDPVENEEPDKGHRAPTRPLECVIDSEDGIVFAGEKQPEILIYEILDMTGGTVAAFGNDDDFIACLFTLSGTYNLRFSSSDYVYCGTVTL